MGLQAPLTIASLRRDYAAGVAEPRSVLAELDRRAERHAAHAVWIHRLGQAALEDHLARLAKVDEAAPLWGVPFAIKDNIDLAGAPTTAACPAYAYTPARSAAVVERLLAAGAIPLGKTNMDQFATGLVGTRSPHGATRNAVNPDYIAGGSSSGSAVAVRLGLAAFALGTDTAGSGRVPAACNGVVGFKPTRGWWSTRGVVPACRTLDCVSVFTRTVADARAVAEVVGGFDAEDPFSRRLPCCLDGKGFDAASARFGYAPPATLPFGDEAYRGLYAACVARLPGQPQPVDWRPFQAAGRLLYEGPWLAERYAAVGGFVVANAADCHPVTRAVIAGGAAISGADCFRGQYRLAELKRETEAVFNAIDLLVLPTTPAIHTLVEVERNPLAINAEIGAFTNFANLLDLCAIAIPAGETPSGLPFGVTLLAPACRDQLIMDAAARLLGETRAVARGPDAIRVG